MTGAPLYMAASGYLNKLGLDLILLGEISMGRNGLEHIGVCLRNNNSLGFLYIVPYIIRIMQ